MPAAKTREITAPVDPVSPGPHRAGTNSRARARPRAKSSSTLAAQAASVEVSSRTTQRVSLRNALQLQDGLVHAIHLDVAPTHFLTLDWEHMGVDDCGKATRTFLGKYRDGLAKRGAKTAWAWVRETGPVYGEHVHILLHIPRDHLTWFNQRKGRWITQCGGKRIRGGYKTREIRGAGPSGGPCNQTHALNIGNLARYICKHGDEDAARFLRIMERDDCPIAGKRSGISQNVGPKARADCKYCKRECALSR